MKVFVMYQVTSNQFSTTLIASYFFTYCILYLRAFNPKKL